jgi:hexaprenyl-diphosphate synthase
MIHVASLLHDDVIDKSPLRRGHPSAPAAHGNKLSILAGNFVLGRASSALSRLGNSQVTELIANVIANLVEGEILQIPTDGASPAPSSLETDCTTALRRQAWDFYMRRTYLKTASLIANGARASVALGGCTQSDIWQNVAYKYGRHLGLAFQARTLLSL